MILYGREGFDYQMVENLKIPNKTNWRLCLNEIALERRCRMVFDNGIFTIDQSGFW